ncbi:MAG: cobalt ECF transporter T component CbiQ [Eubacteriales bacterium]
MSKLQNSIYAIRSFDELAHGDSGIHSIHPTAKLLTVLIYIVAVASAGRYEVTGLLPMFFFPVIFLVASEVPVSVVIKRLLVVLPFILLIGIFNPLFDNQPVVVGGITLARGWLTFFSLFIKGILTVTAALLLIATTGMDRLATAFRQLRIPRILVLQILLTYRYITVLLEEANNTIIAYSLRAPTQKGVHYRVWGSLAGQLLLRTYDRAQRLHTAMCLRGFDGEYHTGRDQRMGGGDITFLAGWSVFFLAASLFNIPAVLGAAFTGGF